MVETGMYIRPTAMCRGHWLCLTSVQLQDSGSLCAETLRSWCQYARKMVKPFVRYPRGSLVHMELHSGSQQLMDSNQADTISTMAEDMHLQASTDGGSLVHRGLTLTVVG